MVLYGFVLQCNVLYCHVVLYCIVLYCSRSHCIILPTKVTLCFCYYFPCFISVMSGLMQPETNVMTVKLVGPNVQYNGNCLLISRFGGWRAFVRVAHLFHFSAKTSSLNITYKLH